MAAPDQDHERCKRMCCGAGRPLIPDEQLDLY